MRPAATSLAALTVYGADGTPLAWQGRPASLPVARVTGPAASFLVSTPLGLRLARLEPLLVASGARRRVGAVVAESALSTAGAAPGTSASPVEIPTRLAPVLFGPIEPHAGDPAAFDVTALDGRSLGTARVSSADIDAARARWWGRVTGLLWAVLAMGLALLWGPLADWRATRSDARRLPGAHTGQRRLEPGGVGVRGARHRGRAAPGRAGLPLPRRRAAGGNLVVARDWRGGALAGHARPAGAPEVRVSPPSA